MISFDLKMTAMVGVEFHNFFILIFLCLFSILSLFVLFKKPKASRLGLNLPPSPPSLPIIGHLHLMLSTLSHKSLQKLSAKYGPILHLHVFNLPIVLVSSASVAYEIFRTHDVSVSCHGLPPFKESLLFGSFGFVSAPYGDYWRFMKKLVVTKLLGPQALERSVLPMEITGGADELHRFYTNLLHKAMKKESVEIGKEAMKLTNNSICKMIMGRSCSEENGEAERVRGLVITTFALTKKIFLASMLHVPLEKLGISLFKKEIMGVSHRFGEVLERVIEEHEENVDDHQSKDMMDVLLEAYRDKNAEYKITRNHIKSFFVELLIGGTDTSSKTIQWTMAEIINNPNILERLRQEIDSVVGKTRLIQETDLPNLPYLRAVVKEGLRLHPPGPLLPREFQQGCKISGFYVPKKTRLVVNAYVVMRDPDYWEDPNEFKPKRWFLASLGSEQEYERREQTLKYLPFGSGRRGCLGTNLAYIIIETAVGVMVQCFDWRINGDKVNMKETVSGMILGMTHPLKSTPVPRTLKAHSSS